MNDCAAGRQRESGWLGNIMGKSRSRKIRIICLGLGSNTIARAA